MAVRTQQIERGPGNFQPRQLPVVHRVGGDGMDAQEVGAQRAFRRRSLPDDEQVEPGVVELFERILDGAVGPEF